MSKAPKGVSLGSSGSKRPPRAVALKEVKGLCVLLVLAGLAVVSCGGGGGGGTELEQGPAVAGFEFADRSDVAEGESIEVRFTCDGEEISPELAWEGVPEGTQELALALEDPDAPGATFTHWLVYGIDPTVTMLAGAEMLSQGENDFGDTGYGGPCPPHGEEHRYVFRLLALDAQAGLEPGADRAAFDEAVAPLVLAEARLTATYARP
jgi:Raf kinase inhibitor-like YbhB/YbcL family protein